MDVLQKKWLMKILIITYLSYNRCAHQMVVIPKKIVQFMTVYDQLFKILLCYQRQFKKNTKTKSIIVLNVRFVNYCSSVMGSRLLNKLQSYVP